MKFAGEIRGEHANRRDPVNLPSLKVLVKEASHSFQDTTAPITLWPIFACSSYTSPPFPRIKATKATVPLEKKKLYFVSAHPKPFIDPSLTDFYYVKAGAYK